MTNYYNEIDPVASSWLRELIKAGHIAPGIVDERSIEDVLPSDLRGFTQCHFFAGIGVWSHALRSAGWADDRPVWTGSCPCQPFSAAGKGSGFDDERHLWPAFHHLIKECSPECVIGEQVASKDSGPWIDLVHTDMEALGYAFGAVPFPSAGIGAPHIRDRLYWVANANGSALRQGRSHVRGRVAGGHAQPWAGSGGSGVLGGVAQPTGTGPQGSAGSRELPDAQLTAAQRGGEADGVGYTNSKPARRDAGSTHAAQAEHGAQHGDRDGSGDAGRGVCGLADTNGRHARAEREQRSGEHGQQPQDGGALQAGQPGPVNGFWAASDWIFCRDGFWRPVEPGTQPLAHGAPARVGRLRGYGNAINSKAAQVFVECVMEAA